MSADGELLAMAAKAAGEPYTLANFAEPGEFEDGWGMVVDMASFWNPLTNYGDTLRLAAKIGGQISIGRAYRRCRLPGHVVRVACTNCGHRDLSVASFFAIGLVAYQASRLKKIDPPSEGDSLPTRRDIEQRA